MKLSNMRPDRDKRIIEDKNALKVLLPPNRAIPLELIPRPCKLVQFFKQMKGYNFLAHDSTNRYLLQAQRYFQMACEKGNKACRAHLVSLARTFISLKQVDEAWRYLALAEKLKIMPSMQHTCMINGRG